MESNEEERIGISHGEPIVHTFGFEELSDVTFIVGEEEFKCHKSVLAEHSSFFKSMFCSGFKEKDQSRVIIQDDPVAFKNLLEILYLGRSCDLSDVIRGPGNCGPFDEAEKLRSRTIWLRCTALLYLADMYDVLDKAVAALEDIFAEKYSCEGVKLLFAVIYSMERFKKTRNKDFFLQGVVDVIPTIKELQPDLRIEPDHLKWLLMHAKPSQLLNTTWKNPLSCPRSLSSDLPFDITFIVGGKEFECNKKYLSDRSTHFEEMFFSGKESPDIVRLEEDVVVFGRLMLIINIGFGLINIRHISPSRCFRSYRLFYSTRRSEDPCPKISEIWNSCVPLIQLAHRLGLQEHVTTVLDNTFMGYAEMDGCGMANREDWPKRCGCAGTMFLLAAMHGFKRCMCMNFASRNAVVGSLSELKKLDPNLSFDLDAIHGLLERL